MNYLKKFRFYFIGITILVLTNLISINLVLNGIFRFPNTAILKNDNPTFLSEMIKLNRLNNIINYNFINEIDNKALGEDLVNHMFDYLNDRYSDYYTQEEFKVFNQDLKGEFGGVGISLTKENNQAKIVNVINDTPAQKAGIKAGDILVKVDGTNIDNLNINQIVEKTRGEIGTKVQLTVLRDNKEETFDLTRAKIISPTVEDELIDKKAYIQITGFENNTYQEFKEALEEAENNQAEGIVIDLRDNGGGMVDSALKIADLLMDKKRAYYTVNKNGKQENYYTRDGKTKLPITVLINQNTASASEILAGALKNDGIPIIGEKSFGKGVIQVVNSLNDGSGYKLTFQEYFLDDGSPVNKIGIEPTETVVLDENLITIDNKPVDNQLARAFEYLS